MNPFTESTIQIARIGYERYALSSGNKNFQGMPMPTWDELPEAIRTHWCNATLAIQDATAATVLA